MVCKKVAEVLVSRIHSGETWTDEFLLPAIHVLFDFINLTQVHNFTVSAQDIFTFRLLSLFTVRFTGILQVLMQIMKRFALSY